MFVFLQGLLGDGAIVYLVDVPELLGSGLASNTSRVPAVCVGK